MEITSHALVTVLHGLLFGGLFLVAAYALGLEIGKTSLIEHPLVLTKRGLRVERIYLFAVVAVSWIVVLTGAYIVYPWYRAIPPPGATDLSQYPQRLLLSNHATSGWHHLGMEWKEHVAWIASISITTAVYLLTQYGSKLKEHPQIRTALRVFILAALFSGGVAGLLGAMINKAAPIQGGSIIQLMRDTE